MARWDEEGRWGEGDERGGSRGGTWRGDDRLGGRGSSGRERWRDAWRSQPWRARDDRADWDRDRGGEDQGWESRSPGERERDLSYAGPYRRGDDYGAREYEASHDRSRSYGTEWPGREERGRGGWRETQGGGQRLGSRWGGGDYTTYGQSGFDESDRAAWMNEDLHREQGRGWGEPPHAGGERWGRDRGPLERLGDRMREGVARLRGRGPKGYRRSDERIREDICERFARSGLNAEDVEVRVENAEVTLTGTAETRHDKRMLEDLAEEVFGVEEVQNHLRVNRGMHGAGADAGSTATGTGQVRQGQPGQAAQPGQRGQPPHGGARH